MEEVRNLRIVRRGSRWGHACLRMEFAVELSFEELIGLTLVGKIPLNPIRANIKCPKALPRFWG